ncbi:hypothetical protein [Halopiger aswanensis]|uniref:Uncharacterized protein n=1 Tax=Halopiger aswanensis TaxID=148449 RepID=A0A419W1D2_9EURY|nr:hypothetical protein [Halopiger aswanensis]RKD89293.1 hypothetical protein ATJ93_4126 [Halopiger aswanensis]
MNAGSAGLRRWTQRFTIASAGAFVAFLPAPLVGTGHRTAVLIGLFGFVCPMIFGMGYLLLPAYAGRTLVDYRLAGFHFGLAYLGAALIVGGWIRDGIGTLFTAGAALWALGVATFVGALLATIGPVLVTEPAAVLRFGDRPQRSTRLATAVLPVAVGYLLVGTIALLEVTPLLGLTDGSIRPAQVSHYYAIGFGALLVFALGARLLVGFYHVTPPRSLVWLLLLSGVVAPGLLGTVRWQGPWFRIGAGSAAVAMGCYAAVIAFVAVRTDRSRVELSGIAFGALAGVLAVVASGSLLLGNGVRNALLLHRTFVLAGFFPLTITGYAFQFFPVATGRVPGATARGVAATIGALAVGVAAQGLGIAGQLELVRSFGIGLSLLGAIGYLYLVVGRFANFELEV